MSIGARLKKWRTENKVGQKEASAIFGVSYSTYQKYELNSSVPGGEAIQSFIKAGINANWLLTGIGPMLVADLDESVMTQPMPVTDEEGVYVCPVDHKRLLQAITEVNEMVKFHHGNNRLPDNQMATAIAMAYEEIEEEERQAIHAAKARSQSILNRLVKQK
jgi:transcriptional regulator with XRE-family HTH domain